MLYAYKLKMNSSYSPALLKGGPESQQRRNCSPVGTSLGGVLGHPLCKEGASLAAQLVKTLPVMWETWVESLG